MTVVWLLDGCALRLCLSSRSPFCREPQRLSWRLWFCRVGPDSSSAFSTSARQRSLDLKHHTARLRGALGSVWQAVSGTRAEIISRFKSAKNNSTPPILSQAPPYAAQAPPTALAATPTKTQEQKECRVTGTAPPTAPQAPPSAHKTPPSALAPKANKIQGQEYGVTKIALPTALQALPNALKAPPNALTPKATKVQVQERGVTRTALPTATQAPPTATQALPSALAPKATTVQEQERGVTRTAPPTTPQAPPTTAQAPPTNQTTPLFHPGSFGAHLGETYDYLSHHINSYFSSFSKPHQVAAPPASSQPETSAFSLGNYWNSSTPSVQAFVGNYIRPLVPRFRSETRGVSTEPDEPASDDGEHKGAPESRDQERAIRLRLQREKEQVIPLLLRLHQAADGSLKSSVRLALALVGFIQPVRNRGVRILSIDGGGTRGLLALQTLRRLQELSGKPIHQLFDYICGVSTGALLGFMLGVRQMPLQECEDLYRTLSSDVFKQNVIVGTMKMSWSHAFYESEIWEQVLKEKMGSDLLIETARDIDCPKVAAVSTVVNHSPPVKAYVFRNYTLPLGLRSHYRGGCRHRLWEALRASSAAPGYFREFALGDDLHQDGGMLVNNPTALAIHECQCLWPGVPLQCVVSLGTGRFQSSSGSSTAYTSLKTKLSNVISSATSTEEVHTMLDALLPPHTYFRFNPSLSEDVCLDESREQKLALMLTEALQYLDRNQPKLSRAVSELRRPKTAIQSLKERLRYGL
ncbi:calcium-independent phospholipase A2-gamma isoform X2 [Pseudorasbora parva]|uniref:calcium-independent phospholipase A2-gamma isoform X2 n=1 Tax=Pseudorasbora parva TaxID=51549 RepID=UPI00351F800F